MRRLAPLLFVAAAGAAHAEDRGPFDVQAYRLKLSLDWSDRSVAGTESIALRVRTPGRELAFTDNGLEILSAQVGGQTVEIRHDEGRLILVLPRVARAGQRLSLRIAYRGRPRRGLVFERELAYASYFACDWMVCDQDRPGDKATFQLELEPPPGGRVVTGVPSGRAYSAYLYGFVAGRFQESRLAGGLRVFTAEGRDPAPLASTPGMAAFLQAKAGVPIPRGYWQLITAEPEAQEGAGFSLLGASVLPSAADPQEDWAPVHELAHQWWGNLVTCESWRDFWLNEGLATFMTAAWKEHRWGRAAYDREMDLARRRLEAARAKGYDKPLAWSGTYPSLGLRRAVQYSKGALFLDALRARLGDDAFWRAVRLYTRRHAGGTAVSADLQAAVGAVAPGRADDLFRDWVFEPGMTTAS